MRITTSATAELRVSPATKANPARRFRNIIYSPCCSLSTFVALPGPGAEGRMGSPVGRISHADVFWVRTLRAL